MWEPVMQNYSVIFFVAETIKKWIRGVYTDNRNSFHSRYLRELKDTSKKLRTEARKFIS
jgi:hypothetical protein